MAISVIIPTLNEQDYLPGLLQSFGEQDFSGEYEIIVVDGESTDRTKEVVARFQRELPNLRFYTCGRGISRQRNYGALKANHDNLVFLDADMKLGRRSLAKIEGHFRSKTNFTAVPVMTPYDGKLVDLLWVLMGYLYFVRVRKTNPVLTGMCIVVTKDVHERIGGFNEAAVVAEDVDYGLRAHRDGARYYILWDVLIRGSARRLDKVGRLKLGRLWKKWYLQNVRSGAITDKTQYDYDFGKFKKS